MIPLKMIIGIELTSEPIVTAATDVSFVMPFAAFS